MTTATLGLLVSLSFLIGVYFYECLQTMGELFRQMQADLMALTLWQRILPIMAQILYRLCHLLGADLEQTMQTLKAGGDESEEIMLMISMLPVLNKGE